MGVKEEVMEILQELSNDQMQVAIEILRKLIKTHPEVVKSLQEYNMCVQTIKTNGKKTNLT